MRGLAQEFHQAGIVDAHVAPTGRISTASRGKPPKGSRKPHQPPKTSARQAILVHRGGVIVAGI